MTRVTTRTTRPKEVTGMEKYFDHIAMAKKPSRFVAPAAGHASLRGGVRIADWTGTTNLPGSPVWSPLIA
ncbi:MAG: hypothetical protein QM572_01970 [Nocardioides sp.]|uniref:hypothetical protein n=1 Tax=Nocardioides sp. TaxID=35761 RepID=UPI0039E60010